MTNLKEGILDSLEGKTIHTITRQYETDDDNIVAVSLVMTNGIQVTIAVEDNKSDRLCFMESRVDWKQYSD